jgi:hypothetical protein
MKVEHARAYLKQRADEYDARIIGPAVGQPTSRELADLFAVRTILEEIHRLNVAVSTQEAALREIANLGKSEKKTRAQKPAEPRTQQGMTHRKGQKPQ